MINLTRIAFVLIVTALGLLTTGCAEAPDEARVTQILEQRLTRPSVPIPWS